MRMFVLGFLGVAALVGFLAPRDPATPDASPGSDTARPAPAALAPAPPQAAMLVDGGATILPRAPDGHFYADLQVNGRTIRFMIDTGATSVALTRDDAMRAGVDFDPGRFETVGVGASGPIRGQRVRIADMRLDLKQVSGIEAAVLDDGLAVSLLGQSFLSRLQSVTIENDRMTLR